MEISWHGSTVSVWRQTDTSSVNGVAPHAETHRRKSFRYNKNVLEISAADIDFDAGDMTPEQAAQRFREANVTALIYITSSHGLPGKGNRWRAIVIFSQNLCPDAHAKMLARVNGILGGRLAVESFTLSQSYYFGGVVGRPQPEVWLVEGRYLDLCHDLDAISVGKPGRRAAARKARIPSPTRQTKDCDGLDVDATLQDIRSARSYHPSLLSLAGYYSNLDRPEKPSLSG